MKKVILISALAIGLTTAASAQEVIKEKDAKPTREVKETKEGKGVKGKHEKQKGEKANQEMKTPEARAQKSVDHLNKTVGLTDDQKPKIYDLALNRAKKVDAVREKYKGQQGSKETAKGEIIAIKKEYRQGVKAILTPEQMEKLKAKAVDAGTGQGQGHDKGGKATKAVKEAKEVKEPKGDKGKKVDDDEKLIGDED